MADSNFNNESSNNIPGAEVNKLNASSYQPNSELEIQIKKENTTESIDSASQTQFSSQKNEPLGRSLNLSMTNSDAESKNLPKTSPIVNNKASSELNEPSSATSLYNPQNNATESQEQTQSKKRDRTMAEFVLMMDQYTPVIPDLVTDYFLTQAGFDCEDYRVKRVLALATQKFVSDIATDAYQYAKIRNQAPKDRKTSKVITCHSCLLYIFCC
ncbi:hypothetical protein DSO57_1007327 [Entomophthora muscae]|uniref:Uncharacterized protein n=1 Tax=Entomophthora muscae TaxID=34485 RepID=A0ACC2S9A7_9FUNG|nr:hypothetical protein DSO57_1007327 [Entomophthora muscae]